MTNDTTTRETQYDAHLCVIEVAQWQCAQYRPYAARVYVRGMYVGKTGNCRTQSAAHRAGEVLATRHSYNP